ncbi:MAG TPA: hypothetical protein VGP82_15940 [Ktedonobacterales bacterium]|jgi:RNA polymerase sigma-70 factor (ECF subfamily)|nr:hypothetical protein [Ktedonobacterales bacterium]
MFARSRERAISYRLVLINGQPGALAFDTKDRLIHVLLLDIADGLIQTVRSIVNPDKLAHLGFPLSDALWLARDDVKGDHT